MVHAEEALRMSLTSRDQDTPGLVWVGLKCMHKGSPMAGASLHAAREQGGHGVCVEWNGELLMMMVMTQKAFKFVL